MEVVNLSSEKSKVKSESNKSKEKSSINSKGSNKNGN